MALHNGAVALRYANNGAVGFAEAFIEGDFDTTDLATLLEFFDRNQDAWGDAYYGSLISRLLRGRRHRRNDNTKEQAERNIHAHYDLGNEFFSAWLDPSMTYSAALFADGETDLTAAQGAKYDNLCRMIDLQPGERLLEIGCGWGGFALHAARERGARVTSITISKAQFEEASRRVQEAGLSDRIEIRYQDYRDLTGRFDKIASIEMFEAVGEPHWPGYFGKLRESLEPGGKAGLQIITVDDRYFESYRRSADFIQCYIFPGGCVPSPSVLRDHLGKAGLAEQAWHAFGGDYARTLAIWRKRFLDAWERLEPLGFDERFKRIWRYYLAYCEAGFRTGSTDVVQVCVARN